MIWHESIKDRRRVEFGLKKGRKMSGIYLVCTTKDKKMEIMSCEEAFKPVNKNLELTIIGVAQGKANAIELVADIYQDYIDKHGSPEGIGQ